ncbi:S49 family peptidase [Rhodoplanes sp. Z2-YC6860]|uniref:S49 family peptidase n=1 Tax=Rhodoplanes sp. Z2-YC6860 TaxID=674703 RepID=UPI00078E0717|nr:S49 family peptidase [Rhodoplanes sp. Z2-YC6860]AMN40963.1 peptidase S49 [Rhodoplanes sp. Z2-YC6860]
MSEVTPMQRVGAMLAPLIPARFRSDIPVVPVVRLSGAIGISTPLRPGMTMANVARSLERAFAIKNIKGVALSINSPGGSAVQSHLIFKRIRALADEKKVPVFAFVEDVAASGGYMIACAADEIICDMSSIVGSIGVIGGSFGFDKLIEKIGVERRLYTAGERKGMLDPFLPEKSDEVEKLHAIQRGIHEGFIELVKSRRGSKLDSRETALFSGEYWTGRRGLELGLADTIGDLRGVLRDRFGDRVRTPLIADRGFFGRRVPGIGAGAGSGLSSLWSGANLAEDVIAALETRALWARYGL